MLASASFTAVTASLSDFPCARLKEMVVAMDSSWWFTDRGWEPSAQVATDDSGTMVSALVLMARPEEAPREGGALAPISEVPDAPVEAAPPPPPPPLEVDARLGAEKVSGVLVVLAETVAEAELRELDAALNGDEVLLLLSSGPLAGLADALPPVLDARFG